MKRWMTLLLGCLLLCTACGKKELLESIALREDTTPEQMIEELSQRYDLPESMLLESAADLAALLQIKEKYLLLGCGRIAAPEDNPQQILLAQAAPGKTEKVTATLQKRLETVQRAFPGYPSAQAGRVITAGDYALLVIVTADDMDTVELGGIFGVAGIGRLLDAASGQQQEHCRQQSNQFFHFELSVSCLFYILQFLWHKINLCISSSYSYSHSCAVTINRYTDYQIRKYSILTKKL